MKMEMMKENYIIYKVCNTVNESIYVGATKISIDQRRLDHLSRAERDHQNKFQNAIRTYGDEAFVWEQIDTAQTVNELAEKEKKYILEFKAKEDGYNSDSGGGFKKSVYRYDLEEGHLFGSYNSLEEAGKVIGATKQQISRACLSVNNIFGGYYWSYNFIEPFEPNLDSRKKRVVQSNSDGEELRDYMSIMEASEVTGVNRSSIAKVCRGERNHAGGFDWSYK